VRWLASPLDPSFQQRQARLRRVASLAGKRFNVVLFDGPVDCLQFLINVPRRSIIYRRLPLSLKCESGDTYSIWAAVQ
jgi:hypothetical protein